MIETSPGMDPRSLDIRRDGELIGCIQWHPERSPRLSLRRAGEHITLSELDSVLAQYHEHRNRRANGKA